MKNIEAKKIAAAIAAVNLFIEEKQLYQKALAGEEPQTKAGSDKFSDSVKKEEMLKELRDTSTNWAALGRMQSMNTRVLWQLKIFK